MGSPKRRGDRAIQPGTRVRGARLEVRVSVSPDCYEVMNDGADEHGRPRTLHWGLVLEAYARLHEGLSPQDSVVLDHAFRKGDLATVRDIVSRKK